MFTLEKINTEEYWTKKNPLYLLKTKREITTIASEYMFKKINSNDYDLDFYHMKKEDMYPVCVVDKRTEEIMTTICDLLLLLGHSLSKIKVYNKFGFDKNTETRPHNAGNNERWNQLRNFCICFDYEKQGKNTIHIRFAISQTHARINCQTGLLPNPVSLLRVWSSEKFIEYDCDFTDKSKGLDDLIGFLQDGRLT